MKKNILKKIGTTLIATSLIFITTNPVEINFAEAKGGKTGFSTPRPSSRPSSSKPSGSNNSKPKTSNSTSKNSTKSSKNNFNTNHNSYNNREYKQKYTDYLNNNYRSSGFFSRNSVVNALLWYSLFNSTTSHNHIKAKNQEKELVDNVKDSKVPVYMLEIMTKDGETKYISVTKEQYEKVKEGDNISLKSGTLTIKN